jgi:hypothetical protein
MLMLRVNRTVPVRRWLPTQSPASACGALARRLTSTTSESPLAPGGRSSALRAELPLLLLESTCLWIAWY